MEDAGAAAVTVHGRTAAQSYSGQSDWDLIARVAAGVSIPVFGSGDCIEPAQLVERLRDGIGRPACWSAAARCATRGSSSRRATWSKAGAPREVTRRSAARFLLDYIDLLRQRARRRGARASGTSRRVRRPSRAIRLPARGRERVGHQQAARAELVVHQGARQRLAPARLDQRRRKHPAAARHHRNVLRRPGRRLALTSRVGRYVPASQATSKPA